MTAKTTNEDENKDEVKSELETETVTVVIEKDEVKTEDETKTEVTETNAEHAVEMAERATELAQINAAQAIVEDQEFKQWCKNEIQEMKNLTNEVAILQVAQAEALTAIQENQLLSASKNSQEAEILPVTETKTETEVETEVDENNDNQEQPLEKLKEVTRRVKSKIRVL